jgi:hypothetical protein
MPNSIKFGISMVTTDGWEHQYVERLVNKDELLAAVAEWFDDEVLSPVHLTVTRQHHFTPGPAVLTPKNSGDSA